MTTLRYAAGTLVLEELPDNLHPPAPFQLLQTKYRCPAGHYRDILRWAQRNQIVNRVPAWHNLSLTMQDTRKPHNYQQEAIAAWHRADRHGSIILPTGAGKTFVALRAIAETKTHTLIIVPTVDLLHQWYARLVNAFDRPNGTDHQTIGVWYGGEKTLKPITVTTYPSAWANAELFGNQFGLLVFDEIHHLPAPNWHEIALICAAPYRLGLTATYPNDQIEGLSRADLLDSLVGKVVYKKHIDDLSGKQLAEYRTERLRIDLTERERADYDRAYGQYTGYVRENRLREKHGAGWWHTFTMLSAKEQEARTAKVAELKLKEIVFQAQGKLEILDGLLRENVDRPMLIFTAHNRFAYQIARRYLIPVITHQTKSAERKAILDGFRAGTYRAIVTSNVLNEGVDVPAAKVAVVLGGNASAREYIQRLGRVLRKHGNTEAVLYEVIARKTIDERIATARRRSVRRSR